MTNGRGAAMASFMTKKKKYKFQVELCLEELLEVPFVSAVLFAKLRLLDGGNFQDHSSREEVRDHKVKWGAKFTFPCKMLANATTGVLERCVLRISVRKECKGGRSYTKLGFVDFNLAQYAGAGLTPKTSILEGYDARHRQDNSLLKCSIKMNMIAGDVLFKVPSSPSSKHKSVASEDPSIDSRVDEFSSGSIGGSIASGSSGFGSLPKKRPPLFNSDLMVGYTLGYTLPESNASNGVELPPPASLEIDDITCETGHSRNSSNTSQLSKASGYSSINSHSRQSSSGDSGHIRDIKQRSIRDKNSFKFANVNSFPYRIKIPMTINQDESFNTSLSSPLSPFTPIKSPNDSSVYFTPPMDRFSNTSASSPDEYRTPEANNLKNNKNEMVNIFFDLHKSKSSTSTNKNEMYYNSNMENSNRFNQVIRSRSDCFIPQKSPLPTKTKPFPSFFAGFLTPNFQRKSINNQSTPKISPTNSAKFKIPASRLNNVNNNNIDYQRPISLPEKRTTSLNSLRSGLAMTEGQQVSGVKIARAGIGHQNVGIPHRKLLDGCTGGGKLAPFAISPDETTPSSTVSSDCSQIVTIRRPSFTTNASSSSLVLSETGSLDRAKAVYERRKKTQSQDSDSNAVSVRVENTRVNPDHLIAELLKDTNLEQADDSAENSGLQLFIAKDGTASLGNHEVKSQMSAGLQVFKQVVMDDNR